MTNRVIQLEVTVKEQKAELDAQILKMQERFEETIASHEEAFNAKISTLDDKISELDKKSHELQKLLTSLEARSEDVSNAANRQIEDHNNQIDLKIDGFEVRLNQFCKSSDVKSAEIENTMQKIQGSIEKISSSIGEEKSRQEENERIIERRIVKDLERYMDSKIDASIAKLKDTNWKPSAETLERMLMDIGYLKGSFDSHEKTTQRIQNNLKDVTHEATDRRVEIMALSKDMEHSRKQMDWEIQAMRRESMTNKWNLEQNIAAATTEANRQVALYIQQATSTQVQLIQEGFSNMETMHHIFCTNMRRLQEVSGVNLSPQRIREAVEDTKKKVMIYEANQCLAEAEIMIRTHPVTCVVYYCGTRATWRAFEEMKITGDQISAELMKAGFVPGSFLAFHDGKLIRGSALLQGPLIVVEIVFNLPNFTEPTLLPLIELPADQDLPASCEASIARRGVINDTPKMLGPCFAGISMGREACLSSKRTSNA